MAVTLQPADAGDTASVRETVCEAGEQIATVAGKEKGEGVNPEGPKEVVLDKGYHSNEVLAEFADRRVRSYCSEPERGRRRWAGKEHDVVVVFSPQLYEGQLRGLHQHAVRVSEELKEMGFHPRGTPEAVRRRIAKICGRQSIRTLVRYEVASGEPGRTRVRPWSDLEEYRRLATRYFGLRILVTNRRAWSTAQILEAYRGQSKAESAFRDLKDPGMLATRPQFRWTDQKLHLHAFMFVTGYLLVRLLRWRARRGRGLWGRPARLAVRALPHPLLSRHRENRAGSPTAGTLAVGRFGRDPARTWRTPPGAPETRPRRGIYTLISLRLHNTCSLADLTITVL